MSLLEKDAVEAPIVKWAKAHKFLVVKVRFVENGYPDRLFISPFGHTIFIEMKRLGEEPEPLQRYRLKELQRRGIPAYWVDNSLAGITILQAALEPETLPRERDQDASVSSIRGLIVGSGTREDVDGPSYDKDPTEPEPDQVCPDNSSDLPNGDDVAGRD